MTPNRGVMFRPTVEQMLRFRDLPLEEKLRWLQQMKSFLDAFQPPARRALMQRFRSGEL